MFLLTTKMTHIFGSYCDEKCQFSDSFVDLNLQNSRKPQAFGNISVVFPFFATKMKNVFIIVKSLADL